ncbi:DMT family transporter [Glycomyces xiaoerkulensis]|uniref:DMT family transporter n=1 Tax=Glycomyces xiaoerkulensis TaxID=2038139 RepID=UPI000C2563CE|nr:DMT family transporter [Glycomyces xiaoerkulensis]
MTAIDRCWAGAFVVLWSSGFIGAELGTRHAPALTVLNWRFLLLAAPALAWLLWRRRRWSVRDLAVHVAIGVLAQGGYLYGVVLGTQLGVDPGTAALIASLQPVVTAVAAFAALGEPVRTAQIGGLAIGLAGVALVVSADFSGGGASVWAYALPVAAMLSLVTATVFERRTGPGGLGPLDALAVQFLTGAAAFASLAAPVGQFAPPTSTGFWVAVVWSAVLSGVGGYGAYWAVVRRNGATAAATLLYLTPPATMLWAWAMFGTPVAPVAWLGLAIALTGVALTLSRANESGDREIRSARNRRGARRRHRGPAGRTAPARPLAGSRARTARRW